MGASGPRLSDGSVVLRPWIPDDAPSVFAACQDPEIGRWTNVPQPYLPEHADGFIAHSIEAWREGTAAMFAITDAESGQVLGSITREPMSGHIAEFGYWLAPTARGRGAATRALRLIADWTLATTGAIRLESYTDAGNDRSGAVLLRAGFERESVRRAWDLDRAGNPIDSIFYVRLRGGLDLRPVSDTDLPFLAEMTLLAAFPPGPLPKGASGMPRVLRWTQGWGRSTDNGVVAWRDGRRVGAAWCRVQDPTLVRDGGDAVPEIAIAVVSDERSSGVGARLLAALADQATKCGQPGLSLTVNAANPAHRLYERAGFVEVRREGDCVVMVRQASRQTFEKLVRDGIPARLDAAGVRYETRLASVEEMPALLLSKLQEEVAELGAASSDTEALDEIADITEVIAAIASRRGASQEQVSAQQTAKRGSRGGFDKGIVLRWTKTPSSRPKAD